jgi:hypothetical protein
MRTHRIPNSPSRGFADSPTHESLYFVCSSSLIPPSDAMMPLVS